MSSVNVELPDSLKQFIAEQTAKGGFGSESDYVQMLVKEAQVREARLLLESKLLDGLKSPVSPLTTGDWDRLKQKVLNEALRRKSNETSDHRAIGANACAHGRPALGPGGVERA